MSDFIFKIDHAIAKLFHNLYLWGGEFINKLMDGISLLAEAGILFLAIGLMLVLFKRTRKTGTIILIGIAIGFLLTNVILKNSIGRNRPFENVNSDFYKWWLSAGPTKETGYSLTSGHTTATTAFAIAIFLSTKKKYSWPILILPILMASSRIYLMVHYFSDCLGGFVVGTIASLIAYAIVKWIYNSKLKFCTWFKEFNILKTGNLIKPKSSTSTSTTTIEEDEFIYSTQDDENSYTTSPNNSLIKQDIDNKNANLTNSDIQNNNSSTENNDEN